MVVKLQNYFYKDEIVGNNTVSYMKCSNGPKQKFDGDQKIVHVLLL